MLKNAFRKLKRNTLNNVSVRMLNVRVAYIPRQTIFIKKTKVTIHLFTEKQYFTKPKSDFWS